jgi:hypothetical protein
MSQSKHNEPTVDQCQQAAQQAFERLNAAYDQLINAAGHVRSAPTPEALGTLKRLLDRTIPVTEEERRWAGCCRVLANHKRGAYTESMFKMRAACLLLYIDGRTVATTLGLTDVVDVWLGEDGRYCVTPAGAEPARAARRSPAPPGAEGPRDPAGTSRRRRRRGRRGRGEAKQNAGEAAPAMSEGQRNRVLVALACDPAAAPEEGEEPAADQEGAAGPGETRALPPSPPPARVASPRAIEKARGPANPEGASYLAAVVRGPPAAAPMRQLSGPSRDTAASLGRTNKKPAELSRPAPMLLTRAPGDEPTDPLERKQPRPPAQKRPAQPPARAAEPARASPPAKPVERVADWAADSSDDENGAPPAAPPAVERGAPSTKAEAEPAVTAAHSTLEADRPASPEPNGTPELREEAALPAESPPPAEGPDAHGNGETPDPAALDAPPPGPPTPAGEPQAPPPVEAADPGARKPAVSAPPKKKNTITWTLPTTRPVVRSPPPAERDKTRKGAR